MHDLTRSRTGRVLVGLTGAPGAGKSTVSARLVALLDRGGVPAALVPMDGFHLADPVLERLGRRDRKGAPDTFDGWGYVALLRRLREEADRPVYAPEFHRDREESHAGRIEVGPDVRVVVTEGNYLLVPDDPWGQVRGCLDQVWYVEIPEAQRLDRLVRRHRAGGKSPAAAVEWAYGSDQHNARIVAATRDRADGVLDG